MKTWIDLPLARAGLIPSKMSEAEGLNNSPLRVLFNAGLYGLTTMLQAAVGFFLLPLYTAYLTPTDYGITGLVTSFTGMVSLFVTLSLDAAVQRFYFDYRDRPSELREFWGSVVIFVTASGFTVGIALFLLRDVISGQLISDVDFYPYVALGVLTMVVSPAYNMYQAMLRTTQQAMKSSVLASSFFLLTVGITVTLVVGGNLGATGVLVASFATAAIFFLLSIYKMLRNNLIVLKFRPKLLASALVYSLPLIPHLMSTMIAQFVAKLLLNNFGSTADLGLFNVGSQFLILVTSVQMAVNTAYVPWFYGQMSDGREGHGAVIRLADYLLKANLIGSLFLALFSQEIVGIMTAPAFADAWRVIPVLTIAHQIGGIYLFYVNTLFYNKQGTKFIFLVSVSGSLVGICLNVLLVRDLGIMAPALALVGQNMVTAAMVVLLSRSIERVNFKLGAASGYVALLLALLVLGLGCEYGWVSLSSCSLTGLLFRIGIFILAAAFLFARDWRQIGRVSVQVWKRLGFPATEENLEA